MLKKARKNKYVGRPKKISGKLKKKEFVLKPQKIFTNHAYVLYFPNSTLFLHALLSYKESHKEKKNLWFDDESKIQTKRRNFENYFADKIYQKLFEYMCIMMEITHTTSHLKNEIYEFLLVVLKYFCDYFLDKEINEARISLQVVFEEILNQIESSIEGYNTYDKYFKNDNDFFENILDIFLKWREFYLSRVSEFIG